jgi:GNAT superfamily N-acetyltransferase
MNGKSTAVKVRRAKPSDLEALARMKFELDAFHSKLPIWPPECDMDEARRGMKKHLADRRNPIFIAVAPSGELAGFASTDVSERETVHRDYRRVGTIVLMFVKGEWRGRGAGRALVSACLEHFKRKGVVHLTLRSVVGNKLSERFWDSMSFEPKIYGRSTTVDKVEAKLRKR